MNAEAAWDALNTALEDYTPPCDGRALFTADRLSDEQRAECVAICARCPIALECRTYATAAKVESGIWAGQLYSPKRNTKKKQVPPREAPHHLPPPDGIRRPTERKSRS